jgi:methylmalonyl-CoA mutase C-terminal domain/subunit
MGKKRTRKILIAKPGLDGHDRGAKVVARALTNAGMEVVYAGLHQTPVQIVNAAIDEDVDAIGLSIHSGAHKTIFPKIMTILEDKGVTDMLVFGGGTIPKKDQGELKSLGVGEIFSTGTDTQDIIDYLDRTLERRKDVKTI